MYRKILIPLDGSREAEMVIPKIQPELTEETEVILLKIIPPLKGETLGQITVTSSEREEAECVKAIDYLRQVIQREVIQRLGGSLGQWHCEAIVSKSVPEGIADFADREGVEVIAMYTHDRKGLAKLIKGSIAEKVQRRAPIEVKVFRPQELYRPVTAAVSADEDLDLKKRN
jgi:nucleotide-binding universal stress UspA family protein